MMLKKRIIKDFPNNTILYDGVCNFCNFWVNFVIKYDKKKKFKFCFLQKSISKNFLDLNNLNGIDTIVLISNNNIYTKSDAALKVMASMNKFFLFFYFFLIIPKFIRDGIYDIIGKNRYKIFGKSKVCRIPEQGDFDRFI